MPIQIDKELLKSLGIIGPDNNTDVYNKFVASYMKANPNRRKSEDEISKDITKELLATKVLIEDAKKSTINFLKSQGLQAELNSREQPNFHIQWDPQFMALNIKLRIAGEPKPDKGDGIVYLEGREIKIKISNSASNNDLYSQDLIDKIKIKAQTANDLSSNKIKEKIAYIENRYINKLFINFDQAVNKKNPSGTPHNLSEEIEDRFQKLPRKEAINIFRKDLIPELTNQLAEEIIKYNKNDPNYKPSKHEMLLTVEKMVKTEIKYLSSHLRPILMDYYPQKSSDGNIQYMHTINFPYSDVSSEDRDLFKRTTPNLFPINMETITLDKNTLKFVKRIIHPSLYRSSSPGAQLNKPTTPNELEDANNREYESLQVLLRQKARKQILEKLNTDGVLKLNDLNFIVSTAYLSLLSPFIKKGRTTEFIATASSLSSKTAPLGDTIHHKNEHGQLESLSGALERLNQESHNKSEFKFNEDDINFILEHTKDSKFVSTYGLDALRKVLEKETITHEYVTLNFVSNLGTHKFDVNNNNYKYNLAGLRNLDKFMASFLIHRGFKLHEIPNELLNADKKSTWKSLKSKFENIINSTTIIKDPKVRDEVNKALRLYIEIRDFINLHAQWSPKRTSESQDSLTMTSIFAAQKALQLANLLGMEPHIFCKSGKDRTGLFIAILEAICAENDENFDLNLYNALHLAGAITAIPIENGGGRVLQISYELFDGLKTFNGIELQHVDQIKELIKGWEARIAGKIGRYPHPNDINPVENKEESLSVVTPHRTILIPKTPTTKSDTTPTTAPQEKPLSKPTPRQAPPVPPRPKQSTTAPAPQPIPPKEFLRTSLKHVEQKPKYDTQQDDTSPQTFNEIMEKWKKRENRGKPKT